MKKIIFGINYVGYLICKYLPRSSAKISVGGEIETFFCKKYCRSRR